MKKTTHRGMIRGPLLILGFCLLATVAAAIPIEIRDDKFSLTLPEGFKELPPGEGNPDARRFYLQGAPAGSGSNMLLTISRLAVGATTVPDAERQEAKVIGRYSERLNNQDVAVLVAQVISNDTVTIEQSASIPLDPGRLRLDLQVRPDDDAKARLMMQQILRSVATQAPQRDKTEIQGLKGAIICLVMVAVIFVVILARR